MSLLTVGSVALDTITTPKGTIEEGLGGSATYFSLAASLFGPVHIVAVVGTDFPKKHIKLLETRGVNLDGLIVREGKTFRWVGVYDESFGDPETLDTQLNVFEQFDPELPEHYRKLPFLFLGNIAPSLQMKVIEQAEGCRFIAADTMNFWIEGARNDLMKVLARIDMLVVNELEVMLLTGNKSAINGARQILDMGPSLIVVKRGSCGSFLVSKDEFFLIPAFPITDVTDPTGAGDSFGGGMMGYLAQSSKTDVPTILEAMMWGAVTASFNVQGFSVEKLASLSRSVLDERMEEFKKIVRTR